MSYLKKEIIDKVYEDANLLDIIKTKVTLKKQGANYIGSSPFGDEKTPSFTVSPAKNIWKDFSSGKGGNNGVSFLMEMGLSWIDAIKEVAKISNIELAFEEDTKESKAYFEKSEKKAQYSQLMHAVVKKYHEAFKALPKDHPAKVEVYEKRKYTDEIVEKYQIGYAPGDKFIYDLCKESANIDEARAIGLISERYNKDFWMDRVIYPITTNSKMYPYAGIAGRRLGDNKKYAKWMNPKTSLLYDKSNTLYGLNTAKESIVKQNEVWFVEGYNDVISLQENGIENTISSSGTAITEIQVKKLRKLCSRVVLCLDGDKAGINSMIKYIELFIKNDFRVFIKIIENGLDPDDYVRTKDFTVENIKADLKDGFKFLMSTKFSDKDEIEVSNETRKLIKIIAEISDRGMKTIYLEWIAKESSVTKSQINKWLKELEEANKLNDVANVNLNDDWMYLLPKEVKTPIDELKPTIEKYQMFQSNNKVWIMNQSDQPPYTFHSVTNFEIKIIQHMQDEKFPKKLVWMKNVYGREIIFDCLSSEVNTPQSFENIVTNQGKYYWVGSRKDHNTLKIFLFESMGTGRMIEVLGWQPEGFWVWNNSVTIPENKSKDRKEQVIPVDGNGVFQFEDVSYYIPSANQVYANNMYKYESQKKLKTKPTKNTFLGYTSQMIKVHKGAGMLGILFTISSMFQDVVVNELGFFPMLFSYGPPSSGKDQLAECCQSFFGKPQTAINLEGGVSTIKAQVREFAQFANIMSHLSEYKPGDSQLDGVLKGLWDRRGYKRGNIDSHVGTDSIPILSSVFLTGNHLPDQDSLITRLMYNLMEQTVFNDQEAKEYEKLSDMTKKGVSGLTPLFINDRVKVEADFKTIHREFKATLGQRNRDANSRMVTNLAVLGAFYQIFSDVVTFPFTMAEMLSHFEDTLESQMNKLDSASLINRFWECFLSSMRTGQANDQIRVNRDYKVEGNKLYFNFTSCFNRIQRQWYTQYHDSSPTKSLMANALKKDKCWVNMVKGTRLGKGRNGKSTSAYIVRLNEIPVGEEIMMNMEFQVREDYRNDPKDDDNYPHSTPATPKDPKSNEETDDLPF